jgi:hypothetical protein
MRTEGIVIGIVLLVLLSSVAFGTFSYGVTTTSTGTQPPTTKAHSSINAVPSNATLHGSNSTKKAPSHITNFVAATTITCSATDATNAEFLAKHVYDPPRLKEMKPCITVTGTVYSSAGTKNEPDGDLHFTLTLDPPYIPLGLTKPQNCALKASIAAGYSDVALQTPSHTATAACDRLIVEVICHNPIDKSYTDHWGQYCKGVNSAYPYNMKPSQGEHITVSGRLVNDCDPTATCNGWNEIHPASYVHHLS